MAISRMVVSRADAEGRMLPFPKSKPPFTLGDLKRAIPPHCFKRSLVRSFSYVLRDLASAFFFYYIATNYIVNLPHPLQYVAWPIYWMFQGCIMTGLWVIGHECGHNAFSNYKWLDDFVGLIIHSAVLTPYFSLKISHRHHHSNTSSIERDELYVPKPKPTNGYSRFAKYWDNSLPGRLVRVIIRITVGWYLYLFLNISGRKYKKFASHFLPQSPIYSESERILIVISDVALLATAFGLYRLAVIKGLVWLVCIYVAPLFVLNAFLVLITYLNHTHVAIPHYDSSKWDWLRGALATIDRDYGILNNVFHKITDTHVVHHLFSHIPHYHAMEATNAIKPILGDYYNYDGTPILKALWRESKECTSVQPDQGENKGIFWYYKEVHEE